MRRPRTRARAEDAREEGLLGRRGDAGSGKEQTEQNDGKFPSSTVFSAGETKGDLAKSRMGGYLVMRSRGGGGGTSAKM